MAIASERSEFIKDLMEVLNLDRKEVIGFTLRAHVDEAVTLLVETYADPDDFKSTKIKRYELTKEEIKEC